MVKTATVIHVCSSSKLAGRCGTEALLLTSQQTQKIPGVLNRAIVVGKLLFHHAESKHPTCDRVTK